MMHDSEPKPVRLNQFLTPVNPSLVACIDERVNDEHATNGIKIPGGTYMMLDSLKALAGMSEQEAREAVIRAKLPIGAHVDEHHHDRGCGYAKLVETKPQVVSATESVPASDRLAWVERHHGTILHYVGDHKPTHAVINHKRLFTIDPEKASQQGIGPFGIDLWAVEDWAKRLGVDPHALAEHVEKVFRQTVTELSGIKDFDEIR